MQLTLKSIKQYIRKHPKRMRILSIFVFSGVIISALFVIFFSLYSPFLMNKNEEANTQLPIQPQEEEINPQLVIDAFSRIKSRNIYTASIFDTDDPVRNYSHTLLVRENDYLVLDHFGNYDPYYINSNYYSIRSGEDNLTRDEVEALLLKNVGEVDFKPNQIMEEGSAYNQRVTDKFGLLSDFPAIAQQIGVGTSGKDGYKGEVYLAIRTTGSNSCLDFSYESFLQNLYLNRGYSACKYEFWVFANNWDLSWYGTWNAQQLKTVNYQKNMMTEHIDDYFAEEIDLQARDFCDGNETILSEFFMTAVCPKEIEIYVSDYDSSTTFYLNNEDLNRETLIIKNIPHEYIFNWDDYYPNYGPYDEYVTKERPVQTTTQPITILGKTYNFKSKVHSVSSSEDYCSKEKTDCFLTNYYSQYVDLGDKVAIINTYDFVKYRDGKVESSKQQDKKALETFENILRSLKTYN